MLKSYKEADDNFKKERKKNDACRLTGAARTYTICKIQLRSRGLHDEDKSCERDEQLCFIRHTIHANIDESVLLMRFLKTPFKNK